MKLMKAREGKVKIKENTKEVIAYDWCRRQKWKSYLTNPSITSFGYTRSAWGWSEPGYWTHGVSIDVSSTIHYSNYPQQKKKKSKKTKDRIDVFQPSQVLVLKPDLLSAFNAPDFTVVVQVELEAIPLLNPLSAKLPALVVGSEVVVKNLADAFESGMVNQWCERQSLRTEYEISKRRKGKEGKEEYEEEIRCRGVPGDGSEGQGDATTLCKLSNVYVREMKAD